MSAANTGTRRPRDLCARTFAAAAIGQHGHHCFGSAGCSVTYRIKPKYVGTQELN